MDHSADIPPGINYRNLPCIDWDSPLVTSRGVYNQTVWSAQRDYFALAYGICEVSMGNSVGHVAWGTSDAHGAKILQILNPEPYACVWSDPWCRWISSTCFIFKADQPNRFKKKAGSLYPIVAIDVNEGFYVYPDTSRFDFYLEQANGIPPFFQPFNLEALQSEILKTSK